MLKNNNTNKLSKNFVHKVRFLMQKIKILQMTDVFQEQNRAANSLAKKGMKVTIFLCTRHFDSQILQCIPKKIVEAEILGTIYKRLTNNISNDFQGCDVAKFNGIGIPPRWMNLYIALLVIVNISTLFLTKKIKIKKHCQCSLKLIN